MIACTLSDERFFRIKQESGIAPCEEYDDCNACPYYDPNKTWEDDDG